MSFFIRLKNTIINSSPSKFMVEKSKHILLPGFNGIPLYDVIEFFIQQVRTVGMKERAAAIAFNFVMAIPPAIIFLFTLIPYLPISKQFENALYSLIRDIIPGQQHNSPLISFLHDFIRKPRTGLLSVGFILSLYFSSNAVLGIMRSFNKNYPGFKKRTGMQRRGVALRLTLILFVLVFISALLLVARGAVLEYFGLKNPNVRNVINSIRWVIIILLFFGCISYIYRHAPSVHKKWKLINPGSILASFLMILCTYMFSYWVNHFAHYNQLYGSIGTVLILMAMIYFNSLVLLIGFELNVSISALQKIAEDRNKNPKNSNEKPI
ncbi:MAG TPA: YihY/virulence factor BrkB family protein [Chitinophagaceae bacterium]|nr:YihY/virulence factor BrkB family protein [Chitinophagaceae bacterium]